MAQLSHGLCNDTSRGCPAEHIRVCIMGTNATDIKRLTNELVIVNSQAAVTEAQHMVNIPADNGCGAEAASPVTVSGELAMRVVVVLSSIHHSFGSKGKWDFLESGHLKQRVHARSPGGEPDHLGPRQEDPKKVSEQHRYARQLPFM